MSQSRQTAKNISAYDHPWAIEEYTKGLGLCRAEQSIVEQYFPRPPARVLDIGCGGGRTTSDLIELGYEVVAIDLADVLLQKAREAVPEASFYHMDATQLEFPADSFDVALFSFNGLDYIYPCTDRLKVLSEVRRVLVRGGVFYYSGHNALGRFARYGFPNLPEMRSHLRFLRHQWNNPAIVRGYWLYDDPSGRLLVYSGTPSAHLKALRSMGFTTHCVRGEKNWRDETSANLSRSWLGRKSGSESSSKKFDIQTGDMEEQVGIWRLTFFNHHIHYVASAEVS